MNATAKIEEIMTGFAQRTGLAETACQPPRRYLWTDAFAVCNYLELHRRTGEPTCLDLAARLVNQVHQVLGRHREDDLRQGWISGLEEHEGERHPTRGGLRIGKERRERAPHESFDERAEWDRDGQYYHYLTKWMHALDRMAQVTGQPHYRRWALELAAAAHAAFVYRPPSASVPRMFWKMSVDLSRPLVPSMGHHDPLDGLLTYWQLRTAPGDSGGEATRPALAHEIADMTALCEGTSWQTGDALGIGGLLTDACRLAQLLTRSPRPGADLLAVLLSDAAASLEFWNLQRPLDAPHSHRLAFRELGLSIGLHAIGRIQGFLERHPPCAADLPALPDSLVRLTAFAPLAAKIESFWLQPEQQRSVGWTAHLEINNVMLAASLGPEAYLLLD